MTESISDFIITISLILGGAIIKLLPKKLKWGWRLLIGLAASITLSILGHIIVKLWWGK